MRVKKVSPADLSLLACTLVGWGCHFTRTWSKLSNIPKNWILEDSECYLKSEQLGVPGIQASRESCLGNTVLLESRAPGRSLHRSMEQP